MTGGLALPDFSATIGVKPSLYIPVFVQFDTPGKNRQKGKGSRLSISAKMKNLPVVVCLLVTSCP